MHKHVTMQLPLFGRRLQFEVTSHFSGKRNVLRLFNQEAAAYSSPDRGLRRWGN